MAQIITVCSRNERDWPVCSFLAEIAYRRQEVELRAINYLIAVFHRPCAYEHSLNFYMFGLDRERELRAKQRTLTQDFVLIIRRRCDGRGAAQTSHLAII